MSRNENKTGKLNHDQLNLVHKFFGVIFNDQIDEYWSLVSKIDQARVYGMYLNYIDQPKAKQISFHDFIKDIIKPDHRKVFEPLKGKKRGVSSVTRFTEDGEVLVYVMRDVSVPIAYIAPTQVEVFPIVLTLDANLHYEEAKVQWKIRLYRDQGYKSLV